MITQLVDLMLMEARLQLPNQTLSLLYAVLPIRFKANLHLLEYHFRMRYMMKHFT